MRVLIIDDEEVFREDMAALLRMEGFDCVTAPDGERGLEAVRKHRPDVVLCDLIMPGIGGLEVVRRIGADHPGTIPLIVTAHATLDTALDAFHSGAVDVVLKPVVPEAMFRTLGRIADNRRLRNEVGSLRRQLARRSSEFNLVGESDEIAAVRALIDRVARRENPVLIVGESGTGKELVAEAIHQASDRDGPFVAVNCAAVATSLFESELFGHARGAFTGATERRQGYFETAHRGTLLLDEVGEIALEQQAKLLRAIELREITRVGESKSIPVTVRVLASTNRDLEEMVQQGRFRVDLFYRLRVVDIKVPPLRERAGDIPILARHFLQLLNEQMNLHCTEVDDAAMKALVDHAWPGNVRELQNAIERALIVGDGQRIRLRDLPLDVVTAVSDVGRYSDDLRTAAKQFEQAHIKKVLHEVDGNRGEAAKRLGVDASTLWRKLAAEENS